MSTEPIRDTELLLYYYRDGLGSERQAEIEAALGRFASIRSRYAALTATLAAVETGLGEWESEAESPDLEQRVWRNVSRQLPAPAARPRRRAWPILQAWRALRGDRNAHRRAQGRLFMVPALAAALVLSLGLVSMLALWEGIPQRSAPALLTDVSSDRILSASAAAHLDRVQRVLENAEAGAEPMLDSVQMQQLIDDHKLYELAARRARDMRLARFLESVNPVLRVLQSSEHGSGSVKRMIRRNDLVFRVGAVADIARGRAGVPSAQRPI